MAASTQWDGPGFSVEVDFGAGPTTVPRHLQYVDLTGKGHIRVPVDGAVDWSQLDKLPDCITVEWSGAERGVIAAVAARPIRFLYWSDASGDIDLTLTSVTDVRLDGAGLQSIRLPASATMLLLRRPPAGLRVYAANSGHGMDLRLFSDGPDVALPEGLSRASKLWLGVAGEVSASILAGLTSLSELRITFDSPPGILTDVEQLSTHHGLHSLELGDAYGWDPATLPELPSLRSVELHGTRKTTATAVKTRFKGTSTEVTVSGAKTEAWLEAHMTNPFRDWVEDSKPFGTAACKAYARAVLAVAAIAPDAPDRIAAAERALRGLIADLNAIDAKYERIDTLRREEAGDAFFDLATRAGVPADQAKRWFDERDF